MKRNLKREREREKERRIGGNGIEGKRKKWIFSNKRARK